MKPPDVMLDQCCWIALMIFIDKSHRKLMQIWLLGTIFWIATAKKSSVKLRWLSTWVVFNLICKKPPGFPNWGKPPTQRCRLVGWVLGWQVSMSQKKYLVNTEIITNYQLVSWPDFGSLNSIAGCVDWKWNLELIKYVLHIKMLYCNYLKASTLNTY